MYHVEQLDSLEGPILSFQWQEKRVLDVTWKVRSASPSTTIPGMFAEYIDLEATVGEIYHYAQVLTFRRYPDHREPIRVKIDSPIDQFALTQIQEAPVQQDQGSFQLPLPVKTLIEVMKQPWEEKGVVGSMLSYRLSVGGSREGYITKGLGYILVYEKGKFVLKVSQMESRKDLARKAVAPLRKKLAEIQTELLGYWQESK